MFRISGTPIKLIAVIAGAKRIEYRSIKAIRGDKGCPRRQRQQQGGI
jgi:hypothetical protein